MNYIALKINNKELVLYIALGIIIAIGFGCLIYKNSSLKKQIKSIQKEINKLSEKNQELKEENNQLNNQNQILNIMISQPKELKVYHFNITDKDDQPSL